MVHGNGWEKYPILTRRLRNIEVIVLPSPGIMTKPFTVENAGLLWPGMTMGGFLLLGFSIWWILDLEGSIVGAWSFYTLIIGFLVFIYGAIELYTYMKRVKKLRKLLELSSKASILKNLEEMEYLAWCLPSGWEQVVEDKKKEFHIR